MADYVLPSVVEKRVRYFDGQFLQDQDFIDEQNYQLDREHRHNRLLHGPGITEGLAVTSAAPNQVTVAPGTAIDSDGRQLVLAQATTVDLPAADFNDKQGIELLLSYLESAEDPQTVGGSQDFTRWLERPALTALAPGGTYSGTAPPVLLAKVALDHSGRVAVDNTVRSYAGLLLPGSGADAAALRATSGGPVELAGSLAIDGNVGIGTSSPAYALDLAAGKALRIDAASSSSDAAAYFSFGGNGAFSIDAPGVPSGRFVVQNSGNVGVGTANPGAKLEVAGGGGSSVDLVVNGRLRSNNNDGGLWVASDRFVGGFDTNKIGFYNGNAWQLAVLNNGNVGIGTSGPAYALHLAAGKALRIDAGSGSSDAAAYFSFGGNGAFGIDAPGVPSGRFVVQNSGNVGVGTANPGAKLEVAGGGGSSVDLVVNGRLRSNNNDGGLWVASDRFVGGFDTNKIGFYNGNAWRLAVLNNGNVGIGTTSPEHDMEVGAFDNQDRYLAFKVLGGNAHRSGIKMWAWQDNYGYSIQYDERNQTGNGLHIKTHNVNADGITQVFVGWSGNVGVGTTSPGAKLEVAGGGGSSVDLVVNGRLRSNNNDGGLWVASDRFVGGFDTNKIGFYNGAWRLAVLNDGTVGIGTTNTGGYTLCVGGQAWLQSNVYVSGSLNYWWGPDGQWKNIQNRANDYAGSYGTSGPSDIRLKADLRPIGHALDLVRKLRGVRYRWGDTGLSHFTRDIESSVSAGPGATEEQNQAVRQAERRRALDMLAGDRLGLVAQDVAPVVPELVLEDADGYKHIRYQHLTALLTEAIKEQDAVVRALSSEVAALRAGLSGQTA